MFSFKFLISILELHTDSRVACKCGCEPFGIYSNFCLDYEVNKTLSMILGFVTIIGKVSLLGVDTLWGDHTFIPADWGLE